MNIDLTEIQESARQVVAKDGLSGGEDESWPLVTELGWLLLPVPDELGGLGQGMAGVCAVQTELGRGLAPVPYLSAMLAIDAVCQSSHAEREQWVERFTAGEYVAASLAESALSIEQSSDGNSNISGMVSAVPSADSASHGLVWSSDSKCVALVALDQAGVIRTERPTWDQTRRLFDLQFEAVELDQSLILASGPSAQSVVRRLMTLRDFILAADSVGGANALLDLTIEHLQTRHQFRRPLAMFQALKHRCADLKMQVAAAEAMLLDGLDRFAGRLGEPESEPAAKIAKYLACSAYSKMAEEAQQLHGGISMASEHQCHLFLKRALLNVQLGRAKDCYEADIAEELLGKLP